MERETISSAHIAAIGYDERAQILEIEFYSGRVYQYLNVPLSAYRKLMAAESPGAFFNEHIRGAFRYRRVE